MTKIEANVPDYLARQALAAAEREQVPIDQIVALALSAQDRRLEGQRRHGNARPAGEPGGVRSRNGQSTQRATHAR